MKNFLTRTRGRRRLHWTDWLSYLYLLMGLLLMFAPVLWLVLSSLKSEAAISEFPPTLLPYTQKMAKLGGEGRRRQVASGVHRQRRGRQVA